MLIQRRLPERDANVPLDGKLPDGLGATIRLGYDGPSIGEVVAWEDQGDGTALATLDVELPGWLFLTGMVAEDLAYGLEALYEGLGEDGREVVGSIESIRFVIAHPKDAE